MTDGSDLWIRYGGVEKMKNWARVWVLPVRVMLRGVQGVTGFLAFVVFFKGKAAERGMGGTGPLQQEEGGIQNRSIYSITTDLRLSIDPEKKRTVLHGLRIVLRQHVWFERKRTRRPNLGNVGPTQHTCTGHLG